MASPLSTSSSPTLTLAAAINYNGGRARALKPSKKVKTNANGTTSSSSSSSSSTALTTTRSRRFDTGVYGTNTGAATNKKDVVVAIDFGSSHTGYAFTFMKANPETDVLSVNEIFANKPWPRMNEGGKTPTAILFQVSTGGAEFKAFGKDAIHRVSLLKHPGNRSDYVFLFHYKMLLYKSLKVDETTIVFDEVTQKGLPLITVVGETLRCVKDAALSHIKGMMADITADKVQWVITVPAIFEESTKDFMRKAALVAGLTKDPLDRNSLLLALEPEAASMLCLMSGISGGLSELREGSHYVVADLGGGTVDVSVHEISRSKKRSEVKEVIPMTGAGDCGGCQMDEAFFDLLCSIFTQRMIHDSRLSHSREWVKVTEEWEAAKCNFDPNDEDASYVVLPPSFQSGAREDADDITFEPPHLVLGPTAMKCIMMPIIDTIVKHILNVLVRAPKASAVLLVGNFARCQLLEHTLAQKLQTFPRVVRLIKPTDPGIAVMKGGVLFGHKPSAITQRITAKSYGISIALPFDEKRHDPAKRIDLDGEAYADDTLDWLVPFGTRFQTGHFVTRMVFPRRKGQASISIDIYEGTRPQIVHLDENGCRKLGEITSPETDPNVLAQGISVQLSFGTELHVKVVTREGKEATCQVRFE
ncbi:hypothetical protein HDU76_001215 [Blyttiomyces sp. JEL0837]|nr:hypothetical protein HDU76_001215 [Blyttiomyces sp. JEL0837]